MSKFADDLQYLLALQVVDTSLDRLRATLAGLDTGAAVSAEYATGKAEFDRRRTAAHRAQTEQHDAEMRLESIETKTAQVNKQLYGGTTVSARDLKNLQMELDMLGRQKSDAEEKVLLAMEAASAATISAETLEAELTTMAESYRGTRTAYKARHSELSREIAAQEVERAKAAKPIPSPLLARYEAIRSKKGGVGAAPIRSDDTCGACHIKLNIGLIEGVVAADSAQLCEYCGRILIPIAAL